MHAPVHDDRRPPYRFCPRCGGALERRLLKAGEPERLVCTRCGFVFYLDPKVAVGTIIRTADDRIVLVRRAIEPGYGMWVFPGGYVDRGETVTAAAIREAREEAGLDVRLDGLVNIYSYPGRPIVVIVYTASISAASSDRRGVARSAAVRGRRHSRGTELAFRSTREALRDFLAGRSRHLSRQVPDSKPPIRIAAEQLSTRAERPDNR